MSLTWLNDAAPKQLFAQKQLQLLMFEERMKFMNKGIIQNKITFSSGYYCYDLLPHEIVMEKLNVTKNFPEGKRKWKTTIAK